MNSRWIECALSDFPDNEAPIPWAIHAERRGTGIVTVVEINLRRGDEERCIITESPNSIKAIDKALTALRSE